jgi:dihydroorotase
MPMYDYLIKLPETARLHDGTGFKSRADIAIKDCSIVRMGRDIPTSEATSYFDVGDYSIVTPGLVDTHAHFAGGVYAKDVDCRKHLLQAGVTTALDAGSRGPRNFSADFGKNVTSRYGADGNGFHGLVNLAPLGLDQPNAENHGFRTAGHSIEETAATIANSERAIGAKIRIGLSKEGRTAQVFENDWRDVFGMTYGAARDSKTFFMTHIAEGPPVLDVVGEYSKLSAAGNYVPPLVLTHCFHGFPGNLAIYTTEEWKAMDRDGIYFDVGQGQGSLSLTIAEHVLQRGFPMNRLSISSDLHHFGLDSGGTPGIVGSFPRVMSRLMSVMDVEDILTCSTSNAARAIGLEEKSGTLAVGRDADIAILRIEEYAFGDGPILEDHKPKDETYCIPQRRWEAAQEFKIQNVFLKGRKIV